MKWMSLALVAVSLVACSASRTNSLAKSTVGQSQPAGSEGLDISSSPDQDRESEAAIAFDSKTNVMIATWYASDLTDQRTRRVIWRRSTDLGQTWSLPQSLQGTNGFIRNNRARVVADSKGDFFITWMELNNPTLPNGTPGELHIFIAKMESLGTDFGPPVEVSDPTQLNTPTAGDAPMIAVDAQDQVLVSWPAAGTANGAMFAKSADFGETFSKPIVATQDLFNPLICVDAKVPAGKTFLVQSDGSQGFLVSQSTNGGDSFAALSHPAGVGSPFNASCFVSGNGIKVIVHSKDSQQRDQVNLLSSEDGGLSFAKAATVAGAADRMAYDLAQFQVAADGAIVATYAAIPLDATGQNQAGPAQLMLAVSHDAGQTFSLKSIGIVGEVLNVSEDAHQDIPRFVGTFFALLVLDDAAFVAYADNTSGHSHVKFERVALP